MSVHDSLCVMSFPVCHTFGTADIAKERLDIGTDIQMSGSASDSDPAPSGNR